MIILNLIIICSLIQFLHYNKISDPTPDDVQLLDGLPKFLPYSRETEAYMDIDCVWESKIDYTRTYTVAADDIKAGHIPCRCTGPDADVCERL